jgi:hypothetical protein
VRGQRSKYRGGELGFSEGGGGGGCAICTVQMILTLYQSMSNVLLGKPWWGGGGGVRNTDNPHALSVHEQCHIGSNYPAVPFSLVGTYTVKCSGTTGACFTPGRAYCTLR